MAGGEVMQLLALGFLLWCVYAAVARVLWLVANELSSTLWIYCKNIWVYRYTSTSHVHTPRDN